MPGVPFKGETVWIIGASSGIGEALARSLSNAGARLVLSARSGEKLEKLKTQLPGPHLALPLDVGDSAAMIATVQAIQSSVDTIDRIIYMAGVYEPMRLDALDLTETHKILATNLMGAFHLIHAALPVLNRQQHGQLVFCASVAGYIGLPGGQPYSASKAGLINLAESLRTEAPAHIDIKLINPGFVRTALTGKNNFAMPMMITPEHAAQAIAKGLRGNGFEIHVPKGFTFIMKLLAALPYPVSLVLLKRMNRR